MNTTGTHQKPVHEIRISSVRAAIWRNETSAGARYNTTFSRIFKNGDKWDSSESFGRDDLLVLRKVADQAFDWICSQKADRQNTTQAQPATVTAEA